MKIAFIADGFSNMRNANVKIVARIAKEMSKKHEVYVIGRPDFGVDCDAPLNELYQNNGINIYSYCSKLNDKLSKLKVSFMQKKYGVFRKAAAMVLHPVCSIYLFCKWMDARLFDCFFEAVSSEKAIRKLTSRHEIELIIFVTQPNYILKRLHRFVDIQTIWYQVDPYAYNYANRNKKYVSVEKKIFKSVDLCIMTPIMYKAYQTNELSAYTDKMYPLEFPCIEEKKRNKRTDLFDTKKLHLVFAGRFYEDIRTPDFLLQLFEKLTQERIVLHVYGSGCDEVLQRAKVKLGERLMLHGSVSSEEIEEILAQADVLVNVNNSVYNQLPSKTLEYIGYGLPILNICKSEKCPTLEYMEKYPLAYNVFEDSEVKLEEMENFIVQNARRNISWEEISKIYSDVLKDRIVEQFCELTERVLAKKNV